MSDLLRITDVRLHAAGPVARRRGVLGWVTFTIDDVLVFDGTTLRRSAGGRIYLAYPARRDERGRDHHFLRPRDDAAREAIEAQILAELRRQGVIAA